MGFLDNTGLNYFKEKLLAILAPKSSPIFTGTPVAPTANEGTDTTQIATTAFVNKAFQSNKALIYKGTIGSSGADVTVLPSTHYQGWTYRVLIPGIYAGKKCREGELIICIADGTIAKDDDWSLVKSGIDGVIIGPDSSTNEHVAVFDGETGKLVKDSGYILAEASSKNVDISIANESESMNLPTSSAVAAYVSRKVVAISDNQIDVLFD